MNTETWGHTTEHTDSLTLIGGPARVGKTTVARRWATTRSVELVHLDHLLHAVAAVAAGDTLTALRKAPSIATHTPKQWLSELRCRDAALWTAAKAYTTATHDELLLEGGLWPDWVRTLERDHTAIFIIDTADDTADRLVNITRTDPRNWMAQRRWPEEKVRKWASYNRFRSLAIADLAARHGYPVFDIATGIDNAQDQALRYLTTTPDTNSPRHRDAK
jgi:hypothetical protein